MNDDNNKCHQSKFGLRGLGHNFKGDAAFIMRERLLYVCMMKKNRACSTAASMKRIIIGKN